MFAHAWMGRANEQDNLQLVSREWNKDLNPSHNIKTKIRDTVRFHRSHEKC